MATDDDTIDKLQQAIMRKITPWLMVGGVVIGGVGGSGVLRIDKYGASDALRDKKEMEYRIDKLENKQSVIEYRLDKKHDDIARCDKRVNELEKQCRENHRK